MKPVLTASQMADSDRYTIETLGIPGIDLMERAARACSNLLLERLEPGQKTVVITGAGNNGGDGFAIARMLLHAGHEVDVLMMFPPEKLGGDALTNYQRLKELTHPVDMSSGHVLLKGEYVWIVDAIFGTGLNRAAGGRFAEMIEQMNAHSAHILAVDLPSGLSGSEGRLLGPAVHAQITVSFQALKLAHTVSPACTHCGMLVVPDIGIVVPQSIDIGTFLIEASDYHRPARPPESHKGSFGSLAIVGGFSGMEGAANLASKAALRFGCGKVRVYTNNPGNRFHHDSVMVDHISNLTGSYNAWIIGPGLGRTDESRLHVESLDLSQQRVVWDADGLWCLKNLANDQWGADWVMTPHPGEAAMLLDCSARDVQGNRIAAIKELGVRFPGGWIVLKGYRSLILSPTGLLFICGSGNAALAVAGSGDVLSGMMGALFCQGLPPDDAILSAVLRHGLAADRWVVNHPDYAMLAEDIIDDLKYHCVS